MKEKQADNVFRAQISQTLRMIQESDLKTHGQYFPQHTSNLIPFK